MEYGLPCEKHKTALVCTDHRDCATCGFNPEENAFRSAYIRKYGLTKTDNGTYRLVVTKERQAILAQELLNESKKTV